MGISECWYLIVSNSKSRENPSSRNKSLPNIISYLSICFVKWMSVLTTIVFESSGRPNKILHFLLVLRVPAAVVHLVLLSVLTRNFFANSSRIIEELAPLSNNIVILLVSVLPRRTCKLPVTIGSNSTLCRFGFGGPM